MGEEHVGGEAMDAARADHTSLFLPGEAGKGVGREEKQQGQQSSTSEDGGRGAVSRRRSWVEVEGGVLAHRYGKGEEWGHTGSGQAPAVLFRGLGRRPRAQHTQAQFGPAVREMTECSFTQDLLGALCSS